MKLFILLMALWNLITFAMMGIDKAKAKRNKQRISERTLILSSFIMGAVGIAAGALIFHHKTRKVKFWILIPMSIIVNIALIYALVYFDII